MDTGIPGVLGPSPNPPILIYLVQLWLDIHDPQPTRGEKAPVTTRMVLVRVFLCLERHSVDIVILLARTRSICRIDRLPGLPNTGKYTVITLSPHSCDFVSQVGVRNPKVVSRVFFYCATSLEEL